MSRSSEESRNSIIEAAEKVFVDRGFAGASMSAIAGVAGVTQSLIHYHFKSKQDLWIAVKQGLFERYHRELSKAFEELPGTAEMLELSIRNYFRFLERNPRFVRLMLWHALEVEGELSQSEMELGSDLYRNGAARIAQSQARGEIRDDMNPALIIHHLMSTAESCFARQAWFCAACHDALPGPPGEELDEAVLESAVKIIMEGLRPR